MTDRDTERAQVGEGTAGVAPTHEARRWCKGDGEWTNWQPVQPDKLAERRADPSFEVRPIAGVAGTQGDRHG